MNQEQEDLQQIIVFKIFNLNNLKATLPLNEATYSFNLIVDAETNAYASYPYYPLIAIANDQKQKLLAIKTIETLSILQVNFEENYEVNQKASIDLQESFNIQSDASCIISLNRQYEPQFLNELNEISEAQFKNTFLIGLSNGIIIEVNYENQKLTSNFCLFESTENELEVPVTHLIKISSNNQLQKQTKILAIYQDSSAVEYIVEYSEINEQFLTSIKKQKNIIQLDNKKLSTQNSIVKKTFNQIDYLIYNNQESRLNYLKMKPSQEITQLNPQTYYKFSCNFITDISIQENFYFKLKQNSNEQQYTIAFTGLDGGFRIYDYPELNPLLFYSTTYSGINCFAFVPSQEIVALGCQDFTINLLNISTLSSIQIISHKSSITKIIMLNEYTPNLKNSDNIIILAASLDNSLSLTEIPKNKFSLSSLNKKLNQNQIESNELEANKVFQLGNGNGIGNIQIQDNIMCISYLDGCAQLWEANFNSKKEDKVNLQKLANLQKKVTMQILKQENQ